MQGFFTTRNSFAPRQAPLVEPEPDEKEPEKKRSGLLSGSEDGGAGTKKHVDGGEKNYGTLNDF